MYNLAVEHKLTKGGKSMNMVAVYLDIACRQRATRNYTLIEFRPGAYYRYINASSPFFSIMFLPVFQKVNVFELGHTYLRLVQTLNVRLPLSIPPTTFLDFLPSSNLEMKHPKWILMPYDLLNDSIETG